MAKKTPAKKKPTVKKEDKPQVHAIPLAKWEMLNQLMFRISQTPDFEAFMILLKDFSNDYKQLGYDPSVIRDHGLSQFYKGAQFSFDNLIENIEEIMNPPKTTHKAKRA